MVTPLPMLPSDRVLPVARSTRQSSAELRPIWVPAT
jgi:hypothetical protein